MDHGWGVCQLWAKSRYGKSSLARSLVVRMAQYRPVICIDFYGDWTGIGDYNPYINLPHINPKHDSDIPMRVERLKVIFNPSFGISDFTRDSDWLGWGLPEQASKAVGEIARCKQAHNNNPEKFGEILNKLPTDEVEADEFARKYAKDGLSPRYVFPQSKQSALVRWQYLSGFFDAPRDIDHYGELLRRHKHIVINFNLQDDPNRGIFKARAFTGKILSQLSDTMPESDISYLQKYSPLIVLEEADKLLPRMPEGQESTVMNEVMEIGLKQQRTGTSLMLITQDPDLLDPRIARMYHSKIMGKVPSDVPDATLTKNLWWHPEANYRQFVLLKENGTHEIFEPDFCPCK